ncbi:MAG: hypothetical protein GY765_12065 [bacterium]|nr:hypothetical protein [bacterium]
MEEKKIKTTIFVNHELIPLTPGGYVYLNEQEKNLDAIAKSDFDAVGINGITIDEYGNFYFGLPWTEQLNRHMWINAKTHGCLIKSEYNKILGRYEVEWTGNEVAKSLQDAIKYLKEGEKKKEIKLTLSNNPPIISWDSIFNTDFYWKEWNHIYKGFKLLKDNLPGIDIINFGNDSLKQYAFFPLGDCLESAVGKFTKMLHKIGFPGVEIFATFQRLYWLKLIVALQKKTEYKGFVKGVSLRCYGWFPEHNRPPEPSKWVYEFEKLLKEELEELEKEPEKDLTAREREKLLREIEIEKANLTELEVTGFINPGVWGYIRAMPEGKTELHSVPMKPDLVKEWFKKVRKDAFSKPIESGKHITGGFIWFYYSFNQNQYYEPNHYWEAINSGLSE